MRVIEKQMIEAIKDRRPWTSGNTEVFLDRDLFRPVIRVGVSVYLHGNHIASLVLTSDDAPGAEVAELKITLAGWNTPTTRSRLTALCQAFKPGCLGVSTKLGYARIVYTREDNGKHVTQAISNTEWVTV